MSVPCNYIEQRSVWHQITNQSESKNERTLASTWCHQAANIHMALVQDFYANKICTITAHIHITWWQVKKKKLQDIYLTAEKVRGRERKRQRFRIHVERRSVDDLCRATNSNAYENDGGLTIGSLFTRHFTRKKYANGKIIEKFYAK